MSQEPAHDLFVSYAPADRSWVEGYLFDALDAARVDYVSEAAFELGAPRVAEFERAVRDSRRTLLVITPAYLADAYAPFGDLLAQTFGIEAGTWPVIPLTLEEAPLPPRLAMLVALDATDPGEWGRAVDKLCAAIGRPVPATTPPPCPYPGMLPFREADAARFFGRDAEVGEMVERLRLHRFLAVIGPSGTGKSSLVLAGLVPALRRSGLFGSGDWNVVVFRPGAAPLDALALARAGVASDGPALVVCDQFEEAFTIGRDQAIAFQQRLGELAAAERCWVVLTVRADFYADLMTSPLWDEVRAHRVEVAPLSGAGLREAIVRPAENAGVHVDPALVERLVSDARGEPGVLPLVQEALVLSWEHLARRYLPVEAYESIAAGAPGRSGLEVAMARRADAALAELSAERQALARRVFVRLVQFGEGRADTRRQQRLADLRAAGDDPAELDATLEHLVDRRLLTSTGAEDGSDRRIDLAHEALIAGWPTLRIWLIERRESEQARRRLDEKAAEWVRLGRGQGGLLDEVELAETERWLAGPDAAELGFDPALADLAAASRTALDRDRAARRRRVRVIIGSLAAGLLVVAGLAVWGALSARSARREEERAREATERAEELRAVAEEQQAHAEALAVSASSRQLAADAVTQLDRNLERAMLLAVQAYRTEATLQAKSALVNALEFSPRFTRSLSAGDEELGPFALAFTGADEVALVNGNGVLRRFDVTSGEPVGAPVEIVAEPLSPDIAISPDGRLMAVADCLANDEASRCEIRLWDVASGTALDEPVVAPDNYVRALTFSPDGRLLGMVAAALEETSVRVWDLDAGAWFGRPIRTRARSLAFSPDGRTLATGLEPESNATGESSVSLWDLDSQRLLASTPEYAAGGVNAIDFTPDGSVLAAGHGWGDVSLLNVADLSPAGATLEAPSGVSDVEFGPDGSVLATSSYESDDVLLWTPDSPSPETLSGHRGETVGLSFSADGTWLATAGVDGRVNVWGVGQHHALRRDGTRVHDLSVAAVAYDGEELVTVGQSEGTDGQAGGQQLVSWNTVTGGAGEPLPIGEAVVALSRDGRLAAIGGGDGMISLIDARTGAEVGAPFSAHEGAVTAIAFDDDGQTVASAGCEVPEPGTISCDGSGVAVWDIANARRVAGGRLDGESYVDRITVSPDGSTLATAGASWKVSLWDLTTNRPLGDQLDAEDRITDLAWTPDSTHLAVASAFGGAHAPGASQERNNKVVVWDVASGTPVGEPLLDHDSGVSAVAFSPDGAVLASGDYLGEIRLWDAETRSPLGDHIATGPSSVTTLRFGPDGTTLASGHGDGRVELWEMSPDQWIDRLCAAASRDLTEDEWAEFVGDAEYEPTCPAAER